MSSYQTGRAAEELAAGYLASQGFQIVSRNWRTRWCEIDIVACQSSLLIFVEVKYRGSDHSGAAIAAITPAKLRQMTYAAQFWLARHGWAGDCRLAVLTIDADRTKLLYVD